VTLAVTLTATYPKTAPLLSIKGDGGLRESTKFKIQKIIESKPKELVIEEQAMIMEIVNACQDILEDAAQAKAAGLELPSLEEERAALEAIAAKLADDQRVKEEKKKQLESLEEARMLDSLVEEELKRQRAKAKEIKRKNKPPPMLMPQLSQGNAHQTGLSEALAFDQQINCLDTNGNPISFQVVGGKSLIRKCSLREPNLYEYITSWKAFYNRPVVRLFTILLTFSRSRPCIEMLYC
jgi:translation initiation factor 2-alpha kinase 4